MNKRSSLAARIVCGICIAFLVTIICAAPATGVHDHLAQNVMLWLSLGCGVLAGWMTVA